MSVQVSDHALVRYLQRIGGFDIERLRSTIAARCAEAARAGASGIIIDGHEFIIQRAFDGSAVVTTVLPPQAKQNRKGRL